MRRRASPSLPGILLLGLAACTPPAAGNLTEDAPATETTGGGGSGGATESVAPTTTAGEPAPSTTGDPGTTSLESGTGGPASTTAEDPVAPPAIVDYDLGPDPLQKSGPIAISVATAHAEGVRMHIDAGDPIELKPGVADSFAGEIAVLSALENGKHVATFIAWRDGLESAPLTVEFTVALPPVGTELFWEGNDAIGEGAVIALAVTPEPALLELGNYQPGGEPRCYLRRRNLGGTWGPGDFIDLDPESSCTAIDLAVDSEGAAYVLLERLENDLLRWWLGKIDAWGAEPVNIGSGAGGDVAHALAVDGQTLAVCGTRVDGNTLDAAAWVFAPGEPGKVMVFDAPPAMKDFPSNFSETPNDCLLRGDRLVMTGEAEGVHDIDHVVRTRHFHLQVDVPASLDAWRVAPPEPTSQSGGLALALDDKGRALTAGYTCGDQCQPVAELRMFSTGGTQVWQRALDPSLSHPRALVWHPAGYAVLATSKTTGPNSSLFFAQAWFPLESGPLWSYEHQDALTFHDARALAIGPYGQVYAGGSTAGGYPAVAVIAP